MEAAPELDVLVIGGGVVGAGTALDAATRGLSTGLVEARDWASGTSSRSSKLIHGGLRYLEMLDFGLVREALRERGLLLTRLAPHLVRPVPFLYPLQHHVWERAYVGAGVAIYDAMAAGARHEADLPRHRHLSRRAALRLAPALRGDALTGAIQYYDAQVDDSRHTMSLVRTAATYGALVASRTEAVDLVRQDERVVGARLRDVETGTEFTVRAKQVVNATGVWTDDTHALARTTGRFGVRASKGVHLVVPRDRLQMSSGLISRTESSVLFIIPWGRHWIIGTTDTEWQFSKAHPAANATDIAYLLERVNALLEHPLRRDDIEGVYVGLRPLLSGDAESTSKLSREHVVDRPAPGLVTVTGGKYTTYRVMAADAVDEVVHGVGRKVPASCTDRIPLVGAEGWPAAWNARSELARRSGLDLSQVEHLLGRYGALTSEVLGLVAERPELADPLPGAPEYLQVEVVYAVLCEDARHLDDVLTRRTRISIETFDRGVAAAPVAAGLMAAALGWDESTTREETQRYLDRVEAERRSQEQPDDASADAARQAAPDDSSSCAFPAARPRR